MFFFVVVQAVRFQPVLHFRFVTFIFVCTSQVLHFTKVANLMTKSGCECDVLGCWGQREFVIHRDFDKVRGRLVGGKSKDERTERAL